MDKDLEDKITQQVLSETKVESILNKEDGSLPFGYCKVVVDGHEKTLVWMCNHDAKGNITSVFSCEANGVKEKKCDYITMKEALFIREELLGDGWQKMKTPEVTFSYAGDEDKTLNRKQKRALAKRLKKMNKQNPFDK